MHSVVFACFQMFAQYHMYTSRGLISRQYFCVPIFSSIFQIFNTDWPLDVCKESCADISFVCIFLFHMTIHSTFFDHHVSRPEFYCVIVFWAPNLYIFRFFTINSRNKQTCLISTFKGLIELYIN